MATLKFPVVLEINALLPTAVLRIPLLLTNAPAPTAVLQVPVVLKYNAFNPIPVL